MGKGGILQERKEENGRGLEKNGCGGSQWERERREKRKRKGGE